MDIGNRITFFREKKQITVNKLANMSGISQSFLREIELGKKNPTVETLSLLCAALGISLHDFFDDGIMHSFIDNSLLQQIYLLTDKQQTQLLEFLKSL